jgi:hypothetical protein
MFQQCSSACPERAVKQCLCSGQVFCLKHCGEHLIQRGDHHFIDILPNLHLEKRNELADELSSRFHLINQSKLAIAAQASYLIQKIEESSAYALEKLCNLELEYHKLMASQNFSENQMEEVNTILKTDLLLKLNSSSKLINSIEKYFKEDCQITILDSKMKGFLKSHTDLISCVAVTKDQKTLISGGQDCSIKVWNMPSKRIVKVLEGHTKEVTSLAMSADNSFLISG